MSDRVLASLAALAIVTAVAFSAGASAAGQAGAANVTAATPGARKMWTPPRTPDGHPDLQGVWLSNIATPLERPKGLEGRPFLTDKEVAELKTRADQLFKSGDRCFAGGDNVFLEALTNGQLKRGFSTENSVGMIERIFENRTSLVVDPADGRIPALTTAAQQRQAAAAAARPRFPAGPEDFNNAYRCITTGVPKLGGVYGAGHFGYYQIFQSRSHVVVAMETIHDARVIPVDGRPHLPAAIRQWNGDSRGRWEGDTLVVDTTNFSPKSNFMGSAEHLRLVERFTRVAPDTIDYEITINDPTTWTRSWTAMMPLRKTTERLYEFACHEGNLPMFGMLTAARADERAAVQPRE
jgi:hypothetical protein